MSRLVHGGAKIDSSESIVAHLQDLLNTRVSEAPSAAGYGVIDFADVVHNFPDASEVLKQSIKTTILRYEPRLRNVTVRKIPSEDPLKLRFEIKAKVNVHGVRRMVRLKTEMASNGSIKVHP